MKIGDGQVEPETIVFDSSLIIADGVIHKRIVKQEAQGSFILCEGGWIAPRRSLFKSEHRAKEDGKRILKEAINRLNSSLRMLK